LAAIELPEASLNLVQLPALGVDEGGDRFGRQKRLRPTGSSGERLEALLGVGIDSNR
jgi:hypothetical protein